MECGLRGIKPLKRLQYLFISIPTTEVVGYVIPVRYCYINRATMQIEVAEAVERIFYNPFILLIIDDVE